MGPKSRAKSPLALIGADKMSAIPSREDVQGAFNSVIAELRDEARSLLRTPGYLKQATDILGPERIGKANRRRDDGLDESLGPRASDCL